MTDKPTPTESDWQWADDFSPEALDYLGGMLLKLMRHPRRWIHRRVDRISFTDHESAHHQTSVDFTLPAEIPPAAALGEEKLYAVPLFLLAKGAHYSRTTDTGSPIPTAPYANIDLWDANGERLPLLTQLQNARLAGAILIALAKQAVGTKRIAPELLRKIGEIAVLDTASRQPAVADILEAEAPTGDIRWTLRDNPEFVEMAYMFSTYSPVICIFRKHPARTIVKLAYDQTTNDLRAPRGSIRRSFGWKAEQHFVALTEIGAAKTHHLEVEVPPELELNEIGIAGGSYKDFVREKQRGDETDLYYNIRQAERATRGNIYVANPGRRAVGLSWVKLRARRAGFLAGALVASMVITLVLALATSATHNILTEQRPEGAVAVLLLIPALLAAYVARPGEHAITVKMLHIARICLVLDALLPFIAALLLLTSSEYARSAHPDAPSSHTTFTTPAPSRPKAVSVKTASRRHSGLDSPRRNDGPHPASHPARTHASPKQHTLEDSWRTLTFISFGFVLLFALSNILPLRSGRVEYQVHV